LKAWPILGVLIVQTLLCLAHWFLYVTWIHFWWPVGPGAAHAMQLALAILSFVFVVAALLGFRFTNPIVAFVYQISAMWLGMLNFFFFAACLAWLIDFLLRYTLPGSSHLQVRPLVASGLIIVAVVAGIYGIINARIIRIRRILLKLDHLPLSWRGRTALVVSDLHLGNINGVRFAQRIANLTRRLKPDILFFPGDLFDGTRADPEKIAAPLFELTPPFGTFFVSGNHEEYGGSTHYSQALKHAGLHVLENAAEDVDGLMIIGVSYSSSNQPMSLRPFLMGLKLGEGRASILLQHVPNRQPIVEQAGVSLMLCGHTHGGQIVPFTWFTRRAFGKFTYGLQRFGALQVLTSSGAGTWGPQMRVGTHSEVILLTFQ
jgi:predicted MPP superfamily phosphohydrolase